MELDGAASSLGIALRQLGQPLGAHAYMRDLVGEDEVHGALEERVADLPRDVDELVEDIAGQPLEPAVDTRHAGRRVLSTGAAPEDGGLGELADIAAQMFEQADVDVHVPRLVPDLAGHVHGELPRRVRKVVDGAPRAFHGLQLDRKSTRL